MREVINSPHFNRVGEFGSSVTAEKKLPAGAAGKLDQRVIDFDRLDEARIKEGRWDVVFITYVFMLYSLIEAMLTCAGSSD